MPQTKPLMVLADITSNELDLILLLLEQAQDSSDEPDTGVIVDNVEMFTAKDVSDLWLKLSAAEGRMDNKIVAAHEKQEPDTLWNYTGEGD